MIPEPIHFAGTFIAGLVKDIPAFSKEIKNASSDAAFFSGVRLSPLGMIPDPIHFLGPALPKVLPKRLMYLVKHMITV